MIRRRGRAPESEAKGRTRGCLPPGRFDGGRDAAPDPATTPKGLAGHRLQYISLSFRNDSKEALYFRANEPPTSRARLVRDIRFDIRDGKGRHRGLVVRTRKGQSGTVRRYHRGRDDMAVCWFKELGNHAARRSTSTDLSEQKLTRCSARGEGVEGIYGRTPMVRSPARFLVRTNKLRDFRRLVLHVVAGSSSILRSARGSKARTSRGFAIRRRGARRILLTGLLKRGRLQPGRTALDCPKGTAFKPLRTAQLARRRET